MDVPDILLAIQWRATCKLPALWQRFGRAARDKDLRGTALLLAEKEHFDDERAAKLARKAKRAASHKRTAKDAGLPGPLRPAKRAAVSLLNSRTPAHAQGNGSVLDASSHNGGNTTIDDDSSDDDSGDDEACMRSPTDIPAVQAVPSDTSGIEALQDAIAKGGSFDLEGGYFGKRKKRELDPGVDFLINAGSRAGLMCRRKIFDVCFESSVASEIFASPQLTKDERLLYLLRIRPR